MHIHNYTHLHYSENEIFSYIPIESIVKENQQKYYDALEESGDAGESAFLFDKYLIIIVLLMLLHPPEALHGVLEIIFYDYRACNSTTNLMTSYLSSHLY